MLFHGHAPTPSYFFLLVNFIPLSIISTVWRREILGREKKCGAKGGRGLKIKRGERVKSTGEKIEWSGKREGEGEAENRDKEKQI